MRGLILAQQRPGELLDLSVDAGFHHTEIRFHPAAAAPPAGIGHDGDVGAGELGGAGRGGGLELLRVQTNRDAGAFTEPVECHARHGDEQVLVERDLTPHDAAGHRQRELHHLPLGLVNHLAAQRRQLLERLREATQHRLAPLICHLGAGAMATMSCCAFSTSRRRTAPRTSISSRSISDARFDMLPKKRFRISSLAPLSAMVSAFLSARCTISRMPLSSTLTRSSKTNIRLRIETASSGRFASMASSTGVLTVRSRRLNSSATARTPPCCSRLGPPSVLRRCSMTPEIRVMTSGEISSRLAMRVSTSTRNTSGSSVTSCAALLGLRCARISAIVCGCSPRMNFESCCGSAFSSDVKPAVDWNDRSTRSMILRAPSAPSDLWSTLRAKSRSPRAM